MSRHAGHLQAGAGRLREAWDDLARRWADARDHWQDANARHFEEQELRHIATELERVLPVISHMSQIIAAAERDLGDHER
ncbi:MAG: hypothetical protein AB7U20_02825 [Planctomycetaceae bacterium]